MRKLKEELPPIIRHIGVALRKRRIHVGLNLASLARRVKMSLGYMSNIEVGGCQPTITTLTKICSALGMNIVQLFQLAEVQRTAEELEKEAMRTIPELPVISDDR